MTRSDLEAIPRGAAVVNREGVRGDLMTVYTDADYVLVVADPRDVQGKDHLKWQRWRFEDVFIGD